MGRKALANFKEVHPIRRYDYKITKLDEQFTVGKYLSLVHGYSARALTKLKQSADGLLLNGVHIRTVDFIKEGDILSATLEEQSDIFPNSELSVPIVYEDDDLIIFNKPYDMPVHPSRNHQTDTLANAFCGYMQSKGHNGTFRAINRLDRDTTGLCVVAKNKLVASFLSGELNKEYTAICSGVVTPSSGRIDAPIERCDEFSITRRVGENGQRSVTDYEVLKVNCKYSLVKVNLQTGRTHQIRVHFAHLGYPLAGDSLYGGDCTELSTHALCCNKVWFTHPITKQPMEFSISLSQKELNLFEP